MHSNISTTLLRIAAFAKAAAAILLLANVAGAQSTRPAGDPRQRADELERMGDLAGAARAVELLITKNPGDVALKIRAGILWSRAEYYESAEALLAAATSLQPDHREAWLALGEARFRGQKYHPSLEAFARAAALGDADGRAGNGTGLCYYSLGDAATARPILAEAARRNARLPGPRHTLGLIALDDGDLDGAIRWFRECLQLDGSDADSHFYLGLALRKKGSLDDAVAEFRAAIAADPLQTGARLNLGQTLLLQKREAEGRAEIEAHGRVVRGKQQLTFAMNSLKLDPASPLSRVRVGDALYDLGLAAEALLQYREALRSKHAPPAALLGAARACRLLGQHEAQRQYAKRAVEAFDRNPDATAADRAAAAELMQSAASRPAELK